MASTVSLLWDGVKRNDKVQSVRLPQYQGSPWAWFMDLNHAKAEWTAARAEKWRNQLAGMEAMLAPVDEPLIRALRLDAAFRIAEVGCGGGSTGIELERQAPAGTLVHGFDISPP
jgi:hypothetical protein